MVFLEPQYTFMVLQRKRSLQWSVKNEANSVRSGLQIYMTIYVLSPRNKPVLEQKDLKLRFQNTYIDILKIFVDERVLSCSRKNLISIFSSKLSIFDSWIAMRAFFSRECVAPYKGSCRHLHHPSSIRLPRFLTYEPGY